MLTTVDSALTNEVFEASGLMQVRKGQHSHHLKQDRTKRQRQKRKQREDRDFGKGTFIYRQSLVKLESVNLPHISKYNFCYSSHYLNTGLVYLNCQVIKTILKHPNSGHSGPVFESLLKIWDQK